MRYVDTMKKDNMLYTKAVKKVYEDVVSTNKKDFIRKDIQDQVFDTEDAIADNAKMISLLLTVVSRMYDAMNATDKANIPATDKTTIDYVVAQFKLTQTRADVQFALEGPALIDKLLSRQGTIGTIVAGY